MVSDPKTDCRFLLSRQVNEMNDGDTVFVQGMSVCVRRSCHKKDVLSQGEPRDDAVNFDTYRILRRHRAVSLPWHGFLVGLCLQTADNAGLVSKVS